MSLERIAATFVEHFSHWTIELPADALAARQQGEIKQAGWIIEILFGSEGDEEYLDYYASHRMTSDSHVRIYADGRTEFLETPHEFVVFPRDSDEAARQKIQEEFYEYNRSVYKRLKEKGFFRQQEG